MKRETANERLKREFERWLWGGVTIAAAFHFALFRYFPELTAEDFSMTTAWTDFIPPPEIEIPPPPEQIIRPQIPVVGSVRIDESVTSADTTLEANPLPPPPPGEVGVGDGDDPFLVFTVAPRLREPLRAQRIVERHYPELLKQAGIGGAVRVEAVVDTTGRVIAARVLESSGIGELDAAAVAAVLELEYTPGLNRDAKVKVKIKPLITFKIR